MRAGQGGAACLARQRVNVLRQRRSLSLRAEVHARSFEGYLQVYHLLERVRLGLHRQHLSGRWVEGSRGRRTHFGRRGASTDAQEVERAGHGELAARHVAMEVAF